MKAIVLTTNYSSSERLLKKITRIDSKMSHIKPFTKEDIVRDHYSFSEVKYIFSSWNMPIFTSEEIKLFLPNLQFIFYAAGDISYFDKPFKENMVKIFDCTDENAISVAEYVSSVVILSNKGFFRSSKVYKSPLWRFSFKKSREYCYSKPGNFKSKIGLIGFGKIAQKVVKILSKTDIIIFAYDPFVDEKIFKNYNVTKKDINWIFENCDVVSNHLPDNEHTFHFIGKNYFELMKKNSTFINTGRGKQVNEYDLCRILKKNKYMTAILDVTFPEPIRPYSPLLKRKNIFLSPHIAGATSNELDRFILKIIKLYYENIS